MQTPTNTLLRSPILAASLDVFAGGFHGHMGHFRELGGGKCVGVTLTLLTHTLGFGLPAS
jgi:hypothetical protein